MRTRTYEPDTEPFTGLIATSRDLHNLWARAVSETPSGGQLLLTPAGREWSRLRNERIRHHINDAHAVRIADRWREVRHVRGDNVYVNDPYYNVVVRAHINQVDDVALT